AIEFGSRRAGCRIHLGRHVLIRHSAFCSPHSKSWSARQELHLRSLGPTPSVLLLHYALLVPAVWSGHAGIWVLLEASCRPWTATCGENGRTRRELHSTLPQTTGRSAD